MEVKFECNISFKDISTAKDKSFINDLFNNIRNIRGSSNTSLVLHKQYTAKIKENNANSPLSLYKKFNTLIRIYKNESKVSNEIKLLFNTVKSFQDSTISKLTNYVYSVTVKDNKRDYTYKDLVLVNNIRPSENIISYINEPYINTAPVLVNRLREQKSFNSLSKMNKIDTYQYKNSTKSKLVTKNNITTTEISSVIVKSTIMETKPVDCYKYGKGNELNHITIYRKLGSYGTIFEIPESVDVEIVNIYRLPYGLSYDNKKIFGRIVLNKPYTIEVNLNNEKKLKVTIKPTQVEMYNF